MTASSPMQERPGFHPGFQRAFTLPPRSLSYHEKAGLDPSDSAADILYSHLSARIVKFSPPYNAIRSVSTPVPQDLDYPVDTVETLPWASTTESTVASGLLIIEKVQGSTNFLKSGAVMHAILRNSQCWCVDGDSKFVLRIGKFQYYRIELPTNSDHDRGKVEELKVLLNKILRFERTPCPFKRGFHVDLPESAITPRRKGTWKRRQSSQVSELGGQTPSSLNRGSSSRLDATQVEHRFGKDAPEDGSSTNGSDYDEDETALESNSHQGQSSPSLVASVAELQTGPVEPTQVDACTEPQALEGEITTDQLENRRTMTEVPQSGPDQPHGLPGQPTNKDERGDSHVQDDETAKTEFAGGQPIGEVSGSVPEKRKMVPAEPPLQPVCPSDGQAEPMPQEGPAEPELDSAEVDCSTIETYGVGDTKVETASIAKRDPTELPPAEVVPLDAPATEPVLSEVSVEEPEAPELRRNDADDLDGPLQDQSDSKPTDTISVASTSISFHSFDDTEDPPSPVSLSPPDSPPSPTPLAEAFDPLALPSHHAHRREISELTITPSSPPLEPLSHFTTASPERPPTSASDSSWTEVETPGAPDPISQIRHRLKARRSLSPLPPSPTLFTPSPRDRSNHLTATILQKACSLALGKPIEVFVMLAHILVRIAGGATVNDLLNGNLFKRPGPEPEHQRNQSLPNQVDGRGDLDLDEDDFGMPIRGRTRSSERAKGDDDTDSLFDID